MDNSVFVFYIAAIFFCFILLAIFAVVMAFGADQGEPTLFFTGAAVLVVTIIFAIILFCKFYNALP